MSENAKQLRRILIALTLLSVDMEWLAQDMPNGKKWINTYKKHVDWIKRDILTSTGSSASYHEIFKDLNSEHIKDLTDWIEMGIECSNLPDIIEMLKSCEVSEQAA